MLIVPEKIFRETKGRGCDCIFKAFHLLYWSGDKNEVTATYKCKACGKETTIKLYGIEANEWVIVMEDFKRIKVMGGTNHEVQSDR